ncbi:hypothetical protein OF83DRAFT_1170105 [Amylostereum chailletii]|nr:hypothetical protein OF83DRAFT_1170105 [Amylostereum chailletii]
MSLIFSSPSPLPSFPAVRSFPSVCSLPPAAFPIPPADGVPTRPVRARPIFKIPTETRSRRPLPPKRPTRLHVSVTFASAPDLQARPPANVPQGTPRSSRANVPRRTRQTSRDAQDKRPATHKTTFPQPPSTRHSPSPSPPTIDTPPHSPSKNAQRAQTPRVPKCPTPRRATSDELEEDENKWMVGQTKVRYDLVWR